MLVDLLALSRNGWRRWLVPPALLDLLVRKVLKVCRVRSVLQVLLVLRACRVRQALRVLLVRRDRPVLQVLLVQPVLLGLLAVAAVRLYGTTTVQLLVLLV